MGFLHELWASGLFAQAQSGGFADTIDKAARTPQSIVVLVVVALTVLRVGIYFATRSTPPHRRETGYKALQFGNEACDAIAYAGIFVFLIIRPYFVQAFRIPSGSMASTLLVNDFIVANKLIYRYTDPKEGDIVVFRPPKAAVTDPATQLDPDGSVSVDFIKRCIGVPGDTIEFKKDVLYRNGQAVDEKYKHFTDDLNPGTDTDFREQTPEERANKVFPDWKLVDNAGRPWPVFVSTLGSRNDVEVAKAFQVDDPALAVKLQNSPPIKIPPGYYLMIGDNRNNSDDGRFWGLVPRDEIVGRAEWIWWPLNRFSKPQGP